MISTKLTMTAQAPSCFGAPIYGSAFGITRGTTAAPEAGFVAVADVVRDRHVAVPSLAMGSFPGTSAWRPPTC